MPTISNETSAESKRDLGARHWKRNRAGLECHVVHDSMKWGIGHPINKFNNAVITGIIWQTYPRNTPDWVSPGFVFPEAVEEPNIVEAWRRPKGAAQVIGWNFRATLRQQFDYSKYPFDREEVSVRLWPKDFGTEITLVPDLISYNQINPNSKPGLEAQDFVVEGWTADSSFFSQRINTYNTNFGLTEYVGHHGFPELYFNVRLTRNFINPFVSMLYGFTGFTIEKLEDEPVEV